MMPNGNIASEFYVVIASTYNATTKTQQTGLVGLSIIDSIPGNFTYSPIRDSVLVMVNIEYENTDAFRSFEDARKAADLIGGRNGLAISRMSIYTESLKQYSNYTLKKPTPPCSIGLFACNPQTPKTNLTTSYGGIVVSHAVFMGVGWGIFAPTGVIAARFWKNTSPTRWRLIHWACGSGTFIFSLVGFGLSIAYVELTAENSNIIAKHFFNKAAGEELKAAHGIAGFILIMFLFMQVGVGYFLRTKEKENSLDQEPLKNIMHKFFGKFFVLIAWVNAMIGIYIKTYDDKSSDKTGLTPDNTLLFLIYTGVALLWIIVYIRYEFVVPPSTPVEYTEITKH